jgi:peptidoglycan hydrolase CwlO-like protein
MTDRDFMLVLESLDKRIQEGFVSVKEQIKTIEDNNKEKISDLKACHTQHDKRINKLETSFAYQVGKISAISALIGGLVSIIVAIVR